MHERIFIGDRRVRIAFELLVSERLKTSNSNCKHHSPITNENPFMLNRLIRIHQRKPRPLYVEFEQVPPDRNRLEQPASLIGDLGNLPSVISRAEVSGR